MMDDTNVENIIRVLDEVELPATAAGFVTIAVRRANT
jgi:hypothetical protein